MGIVDHYPALNRPPAPVTCIRDKGCVRKPMEFMFLLDDGATSDMLASMHPRIWLHANAST